MTDEQQDQPSEEELRAAYEAELARISSAEIVLQTAVSLLNVGGHRIGLAPGTEEQRDLEQVRDAIDAVRGLMPVLERRMPGELRPLRDALAQLQMAYAREAAAGEGGTQATAPGQAATPGHATTSGQATTPGQAPGGTQPPTEPRKPDQDQPGPAEASGRLWVPGR